MRFSAAIRCGIERGSVNDNDIRYASLAFYYVQDQLGFAQTDAVEFWRPGVETLENPLEGHDDVPVKGAILKTAKPVMRELKTDPGNAGVRLGRVIDQSLGGQRAEATVDGSRTGLRGEPGFRTGYLRALRNGSVAL